MNVIAKSASDKTNDYPFWIIWDADRGLNITEKYLDTPGAIFTNQEHAKILAEKIMANEIKPIVRRIIL